MFQTEIYTNRRNKLKSLMQDSKQEGIVLFMGNIESSMNYPGNTYRFRQDSNFLYFFGLDLTNLYGVVDLDNNEDILFADDVDIEDIIWMGPQESMVSNAKKVGITTTKSVSELNSFIQKAIDDGRKIHFLPPYRPENKIKMLDILGLEIDKQKENISIDLIKSIVALREIKEECELEEIREATATGYDMHVAAMTLCEAGLHEYQIAGTIEGIALSADGQISFPVILSQNGETLHNHDHSKILEDGRLMITDAGAETASHYASDFTRTIPVSGKYTKKQRGIYDIVLKANDTAASLIKPDVTYKSIHLAAAKVIAQGLIDLGLMKGNVDDAVKAGAHALFFPHGLGHAMGLDVHDMEDIGENYVGYDDEISRETQFGIAYLRLGKRLKVGMVITNEPGIYFIPALIEKWEKEGINTEFINFDKVKEYIGFGGIRLEDDILVTENGSEYIGERIPIYPDDIEAIMKR